MKIVFFGTSEFAARILKNLIDKSFQIVSVVTRPDRPQGRSLHLIPPPVKKMLADIHSVIPIFQPEKASTPEFEKTLSRYNADLFLVVAYGEILKQNILDIPRLGCINLHASLLPKYRGAAPMQRCLMDGCEKSGITIIEMVKQMDAGDMLAQADVSISEDMNVGELENELLQTSFDLVPKVLNDFQKYFISKIPQDPSQVTFAAKISPEELEISWRQPAKIIHDKIRALSPVPGAWCKVRIGGEEKRLKIKSSTLISEAKGCPASVLNRDQQLIVACLDGALRLGDVQLEGKKIMTASDFLKGLHKEIEFV